MPSAAAPAKKQQKPDRPQDYGRGQMDEGQYLQGENDFFYQVGIKQHGRGRAIYGFGKRLNVAMPQNMAAAKLPVPLSGILPSGP